MANWSPENHEDEVFDGDSNFTWGGVAEASGVGESIYVLRVSTSSSSSHRRGKEVVTSLSLIDEDDDEEEKEKYNADDGIR